MTTTPAMPEHIWTCQIGGNGELPKGADGPMREAIAAAFKAVTGCDASYCFSGWGHPLPERYRAVVENRLPDPNAIRRECFAVLDTLPDASTAPGGDFPTLQAQPAEVSDAEIMAALESAGVKFQRFMGGITGTKDCWSTSGSQDVRKLLAGIRAILALRPQAVPMTGKQARLLSREELAGCCGGCASNSAIETWMRRAIEKFCEVNGITAPAGGEKQA